MRQRLRDLFVDACMMFAGLLAAGLPGLFQRIGRAFVRYRTHTVIIDRSDELYDATLKLCGSLPSMQRVRRWRARTDLNIPGHCSGQLISSGVPAGDSSPAVVAGAGGQAAIAACAYDPLEVSPPAWGTFDDPALPDGPFVHLHPGVTSHAFRYQNTWVRVRARAHSGPSQGSVLETLEITTFERAPETARRLLVDARQMLHEETQRNQRARIWVPDPETGVPNTYGWITISQRKMRAPESVILPGRMLEEILEDARRFLAERDWYAAMGIPWRRGYGLFGPPGGGKTSLIQAVAGKLQKNLYMLCLNEDGMTDSRLDRLLHGVPVGGIVLMEDADALRTTHSREVREVREVRGSDLGSIERMEREEAEYEPYEPYEPNGTPKKLRSRITLQGLLAALDGVGSAEGRILFVTSNYPGRLDGALMRPGRIDRRFHLGYAAPDQVERLYEKFFPLAARSLVQTFAGHIRGGRPVSMAELQEFLLERRDDAALAAEDAPSAFPKEEQTS